MIEKSETKKTVKKTATTRKPRTTKKIESEKENEKVLDKETEKKTEPAKKTVRSQKRRTKKEPNTESKGSGLTFTKVILVICVILFLIILGFSTCGFIYITKEVKDLKGSITGYTSSMDNLSNTVGEKLDEQTSLFYRTLGEHIPVVVPEKYKEDFKNLREAVRKLENDGSDAVLDKAVKTYKNFIRVTPPWIQDELSNEILQTKFDIDYYSILNTYKSNKDEDMLLTSLQNFISYNTDYQDYDDVVDLYNKKVNESVKAYDGKVNGLKYKISNMLKKNNPNADELSALVSEVSLYSDEEKLEGDIEKLTSYVAQVSVLKQITEDLAVLEKEIKAPKDDLIIEESYDNYIKEISRLTYLLGSVTSLDTSECENALNSCVKTVTESQTSYLRDKELELEKQMTSNLSSIENKIKSLEADSTSMAEINIIANELATISYAANGFSFIDNSKVMSLINSCKKLLNGKEIEITKLLANKDEKLIKKYNQNALNLIEKMKDKADNVSGSRGEKARGRMDCLLELEKIQTSYLFNPVAIIYQNVYQEIWKDIPDNEQFNVTKEALTVNKWRINENF